MTVVQGQRPSNFHRCGHGGNRIRHLSPNPARHGTTDAARGRRSCERLRTRRDPRRRSRPRCSALSRDVYTCYNRDVTLTHGPHAGKYSVQNVNITFALHTAAGNDFPVAVNFRIRRAD
jgi:hypothetical protein